MTDSHSLLLLVRCIAVYASSSWNLLEAAGGMNEEPSGRFRMFRPTSVEDEKDSIVDDFLAKEEEEEEEAATSAAPQATVEVVKRSRQFARHTQRSSLVKLWSCLTHRTQNGGRFESTGAR